MAHSPRLICSSSVVSLVLMFGAVLCAPWASAQVPSGFHDAVLSVAPVEPVELVLPDLPEQHPAARGGVDCTEADIIVQNTATNAAPDTTSMQELGQSFTAPCSGFLTAVQVIIQGDGDEDAVTGSLLVYDGAGTAGTVLGSEALAFTDVPDTAGQALTITFASPIPVTASQVYTFFTDLTAGGTLLQFSSADPYAGGELYFTTDGNPANATASVANDLRFFAFFGAPAQTVTQSVFDGPGWRLLSAPVQGLLVDSLAGLNLVQGVPAGASTPAQYPALPDNLYLGYAGSGSFFAYVPPSATDESVVPGRGFFWFWNDEDEGPFVDGTSQGYELSTFTLSATGAPRTSDVFETFTNTADEFYMIGNPFADPLAVSGITVTNLGVTLGSTFSAFDPATSAYVTLFEENPGNGDLPDTLAAWQGLFAEVTANPSMEDPEFAYDFAETDAAATPPFYGRTMGTGPLASSATTPYLQLQLEGVTAAGVVVADHSAYVRFLPDASFAFDRHDGTKLIPPTGTHALLAPVGERDGAPYRLSVHSLPNVLTEAVTIPVAFRATEAGTFVVSWAGVLSLPEEWQATLYDTEIGTEVDVRAAERYSFSAGVTDWTDRFALTVTPGQVVVNEPAEGLPVAFALDAASPNPFATTTTLRYTLPEAAVVTLAVYDLLGRAMAILVQAPQEAGLHAVTWDATDAATGVYVVRLTTEQGEVHTQRLTRLR